jgi:hypothetical protein
MTCGNKTIYFHICPTNFHFFDRCWKFVGGIPRVVLAAARNVWTATTKGFPEGWFVPKRHSYRTKESTSGCDLGPSAKHARKV